MRVKKIEVEQEIVKKKRGRPKKIGVAVFEEIKKIDTPVVEAVQNKRGRPKKTALVVELPKVDASKVEIPKVVDIPKAAEVVKRKGRPKKIDNAVAPVAEIPKVAEVKRKGRPKKNAALAVEQTAVVGDIEPTGEKFGIMIVDADDNRKLWLLEFESDKHGATYKFSVDRKLEFTSRREAKKVAERMRNIFLYETVDVKKIK